jgi:hypothetical protein
VPYNPFGTGLTGTWGEHLGRTNGLRGGEDWGLSYGTTLPAPAKGRLQTLGGFGEFQAGWVGSAGRRAVLYLDVPIEDVVAIAFQHLSSMTAGQYEEGEVFGLSGASANGVDRGGDVHLHSHAITASGVRRQFTRYFAVGGGPAPDPGGDGGGGNNAPGNLHWDHVTKLLSRVVDDGSDH